MRVVCVCLYACDLMLRVTLVLLAAAGASNQVAPTRDSCYRADALSLRRGFTF